jgi:drug/metabolite transporter (DMT)-like permease
VLAVSLSLAACLCWGIADFLGGLKSRELPIITVLVASGVIGLSLILSIVGVRGEALPTNPKLLLAVAGGMVGVMAMIMLYRAFAVGSMAIVAPISASGAILPVLVGLATGDNPAQSQMLGMVAAIGGSVLAAQERDSGGTYKRLAAGADLAASSAVAIGIFFIVMDQASEVDPFWASLLMRGSYCLFLLPIVLLVRPSLRVGRSHLPAIVTMGIVDALAGFAYALATTKGMLSIVSVLASLYPAVVVLLSVTILRERPQPVQFIGVVLAMGGVVLISLG